MEYLKQYAQRVLELPGPKRLWVAELAQELDRVSAHDLTPAIRAEFMELRVAVRRMANPSTPLSRTSVDDTNAVLGALIRTLTVNEEAVIQRAGCEFQYVADVKLREILHGDYAELKLKLFPDEAWKSVVVMAGSILEAMLFDVLTHPRRIHATRASTKGARGKGGVILDIVAHANDWKLTHLIDVAVDTGVLVEERSNMIDHTLRDYRNFVHPRKDLRSLYAGTPSEGLLAMGALSAVCDHFDATL